MADTSWVLQKATGLLIPSGYGDGKLYGIVPDNAYTSGIPKTAFDFDFARASEGSRINPDGFIETMAVDVPRLQFSNGCPSVLMEPARTNKVSQSEDFDQWAKADVTISDGHTFPSANTPNGARKIEENNVIGRHRIFISIGASPDGFYSYSLYAKKAERDIFRMEISDLTTGSAWLECNLNDGSVIPSGTAWNNITGQSELISDGWWRFTLIAEKIAGINSTVYIEGYQSGTSYQGIEGYGFYIFGAQDEQGTYSTTYIKTEGAVGVRAIDNMSLSGLQTNGILGATQGSWFIDFGIVNYEGAVTTRNFQLNITGIIADPDIIDVQNEDSLRVRFRDSTAAETLLRGQPTSNTKAVIKWNGTAVALFQSGVLQDSNTVLDVAAYAYFMSAFISTFNFNGMHMYPIALSDSDCITLTT